MFNGLITIEAVDTLCMMFFLDAKQVGVQRCMACYVAKYDSLMCSPFQNLKSLASVFS